MLRFTQDEVVVARRRQRNAQARTSRRNLRSAVEATIRSIKLPFNDDQLPVRGRFRVSCMLIGSAALTNVRRINRYLNTRNQPKAENAVPNHPAQVTTDLQRSLIAFFGLFARLRHPWTRYFELPSASQPSAQRSSSGLPRPFPRYSGLLSGAQSAVA